MKYQGFMPNDFIDGEGICVSLWVSGCPLKCEGCHNPESWNKDSGYEVPSDIRGRIIKAISANNIQRNFSVLGGEPLAEWNLSLVEEILSAVRTAYPHIKIYLWTGYVFEDLLQETDNEVLYSILNKIDVLIDGPFIQEKKDLTLKLRGSSNQRIIDVQKSLSEGEVVLWSY